MASFQLHTQAGDNYVINLGMHSKKLQIDSELTLWFMKYVDCGTELEQKS